MTSHMSRGIVVRSIGALAVVLGVCWCAPLPAVALPEGRHYELVSPVFKGGYDVNNIVAVSPDGERVAFVSLGAFAGTPADNPLSNFYVARREAGVAWSSAPLLPPPALVPFSAAIDFTPTLDTAVYEARLGPTYGRAAYEKPEQEYLLHAVSAQDVAPNAPDPAPNFEVAGMVLKDRNETSFSPAYEGASADLAHIAFEVQGAGSEQLLPEAAKSESHLYDLATGVGGGERSLRLVGLNNEGKGGVINPSCRAKLGSGASRLNAISTGVDEAFFTTAVDPSCAAEQLFVRLGGQRTLEVSRPLFPACSKVPCAGAEERAPGLFQGASEDGSKVFFTSTQPLVPGDTDASSNLYMASIGCPAPGESGCSAPQRTVTGLAQVSRDLNSGGPAEVKDVVRVAPDGSRAYYVARGDLLDPGQQAALEADGRPLPLAGADNLYVYDSVSGTTTFIADLCSGPRASGAVEDIRCPTGLDDGEGPQLRNDTVLWTSSEREAQLNLCARPSAGECTSVRESGRFLLFSSYAQLTPDDTDGARDVYCYDAATGVLQRVSVGEGGYDANGNGDAFDAGIGTTGAQTSSRLYEQHELKARAITEDGSRVVFTTAEPLSPDAKEGVASAYEWTPEGVSLVSAGTAAVGGVVISSTGGDVFFTTTQGILPQDTDGQLDVYDARLGAGFPPAVVPPAPCSGDACQGPLTNPAALLVPGSISQAPGENLAAPVAPQSPKQKAKTPPRCARGKHVSHGKCDKNKKKAKAKNATKRRRAR